MLEATSQCSFARRLKIIDNQLEISTGLIEGDRAAHQHLGTVFDLAPIGRTAITEHGAPDLRAFVFKGKVNMPRGRGCQIRHLTGQPYRTEMLFKQFPRLAREVTDLIDNIVHWTILT